MSTAQLKKLIKKHIDQADDKLLKMLIAMVEVYQEEDDPIISYDVNGNSRRVSELQVILKEQLELGRKGKYISIDDLDKKSKEWLNHTK